MDYIHNILTIVAIAFPSTALAQSSLCQCPTQKGGYTQLTQPTDFAIINDRAYILNDAGNELITLDLSTAPNYTLISTLTFNDTGYLEITAAGNAQHARMDARGTPFGAWLIICGRRGRSLAVT